VPYFDLGRSRTALSADDFRAVKRPVVVTEQPDLWELTAAATFEQVRLDGKGTGMVRGVAWGALVHQAPWRYSRQVWVEEPVRRILASAAMPDSIVWRRVPVVAE
jgi:hypothetical protein